MMNFGIEGSPPFDVLGGVRVYSSPHAMVTGPAREHKEGRKLSYHKRIQKKWNKRFGFKSAPGAYMTPAGLIAHPEIIKAMKEAA